MQCPACQTEVPAWSRFCPNCGRRLGTEELKLRDADALEKGQAIEQVEVSLGEIQTCEAVPDSGEQRKGELVGSRYRIQEVIGEGGMGVVYRALDENLSRLVAVKRLRSAEDTGKRGIQRFTGEARAVASLNHRNIVQIYELANDEKGPYIVTELIEGPTLSQHIRDHGALSRGEAHEIFLAVCQAVSYAHRRSPKVIHRDIKTANVLLKREPEGSLTPKLTDFGLARIGVESELSMTGFGMGTLAYVAPEQRRSAKTADERSDIYSLAKVLYEMLTGELPDNIDYGLIDDNYHAFLQKALRTDPSERFYTVREMMDALTEALRGSEAQTSRDAIIEGACPECGHRNPLENGFCESCGAGLFTECPICQAEVRSGLEFCGKCGTNIRQWREIQDRLRRAQEYQEQKRYSRVLKECEFILAKEPDNRDAADLKRKAESALETLRQLRSEANSLQSEGRYEQEQAKLEEIRELGGADETLEARLAELEQYFLAEAVREALSKAEQAEADGRLDDARDFYDEACEITPDDEALTSARDELVERIARARQLLEEARAAAREGRHERVIELVRDLDHCWPKHPEAAALFEVADGALTRVGELKHQAVELRERENPEAEKQCIEEGLRIAPHEVFFRDRLDEVNHLLRLREAGEAREEGLQALADGHYAQAKVRLDKALELAPEDAEARRGLLEAEAMLGDVTQTAERIRPLVEEAGTLLKRRTGYRQVREFCADAVSRSQQFAAADQWTESNYRHEPILEIKSLRARARKADAEAAARIARMEELATRAAALEARSDYTGAVALVRQIGELDAESETAADDLARLRRLRWAQLRRRTRARIAAVVLVLLAMAAWISVHLLLADSVRSRAGKAFNQSDYPAVLELADEYKRLLRAPLVPDGLAAPEEMARLRASALRDWFEGLMEEARTLQKDRRYRQTLPKLEEALQLRERDAEATRRIAECNDRIAEYEKEIESGQADLVARFPEKAEEAFKRAELIYPHGEAADLLGKVATILQGAADQFGRAQTAFREQDYVLASELAQAVLDEFDKEHAGAKKIKADVATVLGQINTLLKDAQLLVDEKKIDEAAEKLVALLALKKDHKDGKDLKQDVDNDIIRRDKYLDEARKALAHAETTGNTEDYKDAISKAQEVIKLDPDNVEAADIIRRAMINVPPDGFVAVRGGQTVMGLSDRMLDTMRQMPGFTDETAFATERPSRIVILKGFWIQDHEVTNAEYCTFLNSFGEKEDVPDGCVPDTPGREIALVGRRYKPAEGKEDYPARGVTWDGASAYCTWRGKELEKLYGEKVRLQCHLPTEAQWEMAASWESKPRTKRLFPWGDEATETPPKIRGTGECRKVGSCPEDTSSCEARDMAGNVMEWCQDYFAEDYYEKANAKGTNKIDPHGPEEGLTRSVRGGCYNSENALDFRTTVRIGVSPKAVNPHVGFRVVIEIRTESSSAQRL